MAVEARFSADDYAGAARAMMPRGPAWPDDPNSVQGKVLRALVQSLVRVDATAMQLLVDAFPATTENLLEEWEATLGLPDSALGDNPTEDQRRAQVVARLVGAAGQSRERFIAFAATLGFTITISNYAPLRVGYFRAGDAAYGVAWADALGIHIASNTGGLTPAALKAELDKIKPAESVTILI